MLVRAPNRFKRALGPQQALAQLGRN
jgi:hypothetical protein